jgi:signal transduction histidine kinase
MTPAPGMRRLGLRLPQPTIRLRFTLLYTGLFLACGLGLLGITYLLLAHKYGGNFFAVPVPAGSSDVAHAAPNGAGAQAVAQELAQKALDQLPVRFGIALAIMTALSVALAWRLAGRVLRPLSTMTETAGEISASSLDRRLGLEGPDDEVRRLGEAFDGLLARLEASFEAQRRFVANASHELRTPLTYERTLLEVALADPDPSAGSLREVCEQLLVSEGRQERLIDALLTLALGQAGLQRREPFDLASTSEAVLLGHREEMERRGLELRSGLASARATGDPRLVERLVANLVDNALCHNVDHGSIDVTTGTQAGQALLTVANTGQAVSAEDIEQLFEPFRRAEADRTRLDEGHGLGLSIVRAIADAHGATVRVESPAGGGLLVEVRFPAVTPPVKSPNPSTWDD